MKKTLIALAAVAATGAAFAQSTVALSGTFDLSVQNAKNDVGSATSMSKNGMASSRIQFAGTEDLGGGMKANFTCDTTLTPNAGVAYASASASASATTSFCDRIGLVGVQGGFGRVDLGGDYTPLFRITGIADPFGTNGVGSWYNLGGVIARGVDLATTSISSGVYVQGLTNASLASPWYASAAAASAASGARLTESVASVNAARANNTITYSTPVFNGVQAVAMYMVDGNASTNTTGKLGAGTSLRVRYDAGPLTLAVGTQTIKHGVTTTTTANVGTTILAGSYDFGVAKATFGYQTQKLESLKGTDTILGLIVPMGANTIKASYAIKSVDTANSTGEFGAKQLALGIAHALSKRTDVYAQYARVTNDANAQYGVLTPTAGSSATAYQVGVRHAF
ncbi:porin [Limnohabitans sp. 2KL-27]|uniref:porin n=1 Tax=Limnohabitans sp. 2KL-27 TaxID=1100705 RepID=UPI000B2A32C3|nr:porin [Limnohabitans sp. 2KL-27]